MDEARARALLELAAGTEAPPTRVNVELARSRGRRKLRWRATGLAAVPVLAALATVGVAVGVPVPFGPGGNAASQRSSAASPGATPATHRPLSSAGRTQVTPPRRFNPLIPYAAFGWLPPDTLLNGGQTAPTYAYLTAGRPKTWALTVFTVGRCNLTSTQVLGRLRQHRQPQLTCRQNSSSGFVYQAISTAPRVDGHLAFWSTGHGYLFWEYARGSWVALAHPQRAAIGVTIKVADNVRYDVATKPSIEFAAQLTGLPSAWKVDYVYFVRDAGVLRASQYTLSAGPASPFFTVDPATRRSSCYFYPDGQSAHRVIDGYRVTVNHIKSSRGNPPIQQVCAADADGLAVFVSTYGKNASPNAISIFANHMRLLGTNPADWTTRPVVKPAR
jgi:hypothetical protein